MFGAAALFATSLAQTTLADNAAGQPTARVSDAKVRALPSGFKSVPVDAIKGPSLALANPVVTRNSLNNHLSLTPPK
jgi:hypothetical protein